MRQIRTLLLAGQGEKPGRLATVVLVATGVEGKTTVSIGLAQGLQRAGQRVALALREPSPGPIFGIKGGGTGGGRCQVDPSTRINMHFTGDLHAVGAAHNLLAALVDTDWDQAQMESSGMEQTHDVMARLAGSNPAAADGWRRPAKICGAWNLLSYREK